MRPEPRFARVRPLFFAPLAVTFCTMYAVVCLSLQHRPFLASSVIIMHSPLCIIVLMFLAVLSDVDHDQNCSNLFVFYTHVYHLCWLLEKRFCLWLLSRAS